MRRWIIGALLVLIAGGLYWRLRPKPPVLGESYVGEANMTVWTTTAQVRQSVAELHWGDQVEILARSATQDQVRTHQGIVGWVDNRSLLDYSVWQQERRLLDDTRGMPLQSAGHTKVYTNVRVQPGRDTQRVYQFPGEVPLAIFGRAAVEAPQAGSSSDGAAEPAKREDWLLVYGPSPGSAIAAGATPSTIASAAASTEPSEKDLVVGSSTPAAGGVTSNRQSVPQVAGWVLARFVEFDLPEALRDYASSSGTRPVAWFVLNRVADPAGARPQFLLAGIKGGEGQSCDFNLLRVYTWDVAHQRYETAFVESDFCGYLPVRLGKQVGTGDPEFHFEGMSKDGTKEDWLYRMRQTTVHRVREGEPLRKNRP
jgi:hypothetical protein